MPRRVQHEALAWHRRGVAAATARRSRLMRTLRMSRYHLLQLAVRAHRKFTRRSERIGWFEFVPPAASATERADVMSRAGWYLSDLGLPVEIDGPECIPDDAPWMEAENSQKVVVRSSDGTEVGTVGHRLIHRASARVMLRSLASSSPITMVDPTLFNATDCWGYENVRRAYLADAPNVAVLHPRFVELIGEAQRGNARAIVVATGPTADSFDFASIGYDLRITCNSAVRNADLLRALRPNVIAFADPVFHFGPSRYAAAFRRDACRAVAMTGALLLVPAGYAGLLLHHHPELREHVAAFAPDAPSWAWPAPADGRFSVRSTANVLTLAMLPAALAAAEEVHIAGSDGRAAGERYFWRHSTKLQYSDELMESAFTAHPSFFRDRHYSDYYAEHCAEVESLISYAERHGKRVRAVTPSHIPALQRRQDRALPDN